MVYRAVTVSVFVLLALLLYYITLIPLLNHIILNITKNIMSEETNLDNVSFSVLSWNIWFGSRGGWDFPEKRWTHLLQIIVDKDPDVVGFQECTDQFLRQVQSEQFHDKYVSINEPPKGHTYYVMVYKRKSLKIKSTDTILLKTNLGRRCEVVTLKKDNLSFRFGTVHIESYITSEFVREIQMQTIFNALMENSSSLELAFLVGDFNFHETEKENKVIDESVFVDTWPVVHPTQKGYTFENQVNLMNKHSLVETDGVTKLLQKRLDRILFWDPRQTDWKPVVCELLGTSSIGEVPLPNTVPVEKVYLFPSDHFGLFARFEKKPDSLPGGNEKKGLCKIM